MAYGSATIARGSGLLLVGVGLFAFAVGFIVMLATNGVEPEPYYVVAIPMPIEAEEMTIAALEPLPTPEATEAPQVIEPPKLTNAPAVPTRRKVAPAKAEEHAPISEIETLNPF